MFLSFVAFLASLLMGSSTFGAGTGTITQIDQWKSDGTNITQRTASKPIKLTGLENLPCLGTNGSGVIGAGTCTGGGGASFSTTSANYWAGLGLAFSTTSTNYWLTTKSLTGASTTILSDFNTWTGGNVFGRATTTYLGINSETFTDLTGDGLINNSGVLDFNCADVNGNGLSCSANNLVVQLGTSISVGEMTSTDFGDWTCNGVTCTLDADTVSDSEIDYATVTLADFTNDAGFITSSTFSTTSANYWASVGLAYSTTSTLADLTTYNKGFFFSSTSADAWGALKGYLTTVDISANTNLAVTYPMVLTNDTLSLAFGTTSNNSWSGLNAFANITAAGATSTTFSTGVASTSFLWISNVRNGVVAVGTTGNTYSIATSTPTVTAPLAYSGTLGSFVGGTGGAFSIPVGTASANGYLALGDWTLFNNKVSTTSIDTIGEVEVLWGSINVIAATEIDTCSEFAAIMGGETGTCGSLVLSADPTFTGQLVFANASGTQATSTYFTTHIGSTTQLTISDSRSGVLIGSATGRVSAVGAQTCTNQFVRVMSAAYVATCATVGSADMNLTTAFTWTGLHTFNTGGIISNASSSIMGSVFTGTAGRIGLASSTPSVNWGLSIGTTTMIANAQFSIMVSSSTSNTASITVNWETGNTQPFILQQNTTIVLNSTSSNPRDGAKYILDLCQDPVGSRTVTFATPGQLVWLTPEGTTTVNAAANTITSIGMEYRARLGRYLIRATSTASDTRACRP